MPNETTIRADECEMLAGWVGPAIHRDQDVAVLGPDATMGGERWLVASRYGIESVDLAALRLDCLRPEVQARVGSVLAAGVRCAACGGRGSVRASVQPGCDGECPEPCGCDAGYLRKPSPIYHLTDAIRTGALSNQHIAEAVAWSVRSVARGGEVLADVAGSWADTGDTDEPFMERASLTRSRDAAYVSGAEWRVYPVPSGFVRGPETGPEGRAKADAALLAANIAYIDGGALVLPGELS